MKKRTKRAVILLAGASVIGFVTAVFIRNKRIKEYKSKYYTLADLFASETAAKLGIKNITEDDTYLLNMKALIKFVLDPLCDAYGTRIHINSGFRTKQLNDAIDGSSSSSQHMTGEAADLDTGSKSGNKRLYEILRGMNFDQLINEHDYSWIHVSYKRNGINRRHII